ncbi:lipoprotein [Candidatus Regiella insecticola LSR1]|uniref:Outer membrane protein assembly factor BamC n=1 Tax=Candidatus Regiella insecticola LSR1 TaxID=663321 RepID=E0WTE9_9ENTR|nr:outer membrane protein assembly factor BamC [Candidatus Regiella insecticola]EFL91834.1 lipoprotein [Candidatus Regiella insecticola LSR1]
MAILQKSVMIKIISVLWLMLLAACSTEQRYKRQVSGDEAYLNAPALKRLNASQGIILPLQHGTYDIAQVSQQGAVGKQLDIRPPIQPLVLLKGSRIESTADISKLLLDNNRQNDTLWSQITTVMQNESLPIADRQDANQTLTTDWIKWNRADEDVPFAGRYQISVQQQGNQLALVVKSLGLQQQEKMVTSNIEIQHYNRAMLNKLIEGLDKIRSNSNNAQNTDKIGRLEVQAARDDSALPRLIVRAPYAIVWQRLPPALAKIGMTVTKRDRQQGNIAVTYSPINSRDWDALGAQDPKLKSGSYQLQVGDFGNRSSVQFTDSKGHTLNQQQNDALVAVLRAALNQNDAK